jgi:hypothetical protein
MRISRKQTMTGSFVVQSMGYVPDHGESPLVRKVGWPCRAVPTYEQVFTELNEKAGRGLLERINSKIEVKGSRSVTNLYGSSRASEISQLYGCHLCFLMKGHYHG